MGQYLTTRYPGIFEYVGKNGRVYGIDYRVGGKKHREIVGPLLGEARNKLKEKQDLGKRGVYIQKKKTLRELVQEYVMLEGDSPSYKKSSYSYLGKWVEDKDGTMKWKDGCLTEQFGDMPLCNITPYEVENYKKKREDAPVRGQGGTLRKRSAASINRPLEELQKLLNRAVIWNWLESNPFEKFDSKLNPIFEAEDDSRCRCLSDDERVRFLDATKESPEYMEYLVKGAIFTGLRRSDLLKLKWTDVDMDKATITFVEQKKRHRQPQKIVKLINQDMVTLLKSIPVRGEYIFCKKDGSPLKSPRNSFLKALKRAGIKNFRFHDFRHTSATYLLERGAPLEAIQKHLNHSNITMTQRYAHIQEDYQRKHLQKLDGIFDVPEESGKKLVRNEELEGNEAEPTIDATA